MLTGTVHSHMSKHQLANAHKLLGDIYFDKNITGSALQHYTIALSMNPQLPVKRKMKTLRSLAQEELKYSIDANLAGKPDYTNLTLHKSEPTDECIKKRKKQLEEIAKRWGMTVDELNDIEQRTRKQLKSDATNDNKIYDPEFEREIEERLSRLNDISRNEFYRIRSERSESDILSNKELDLLTLEDMERSFHYHNG